MKTIKNHILLTPYTMKLISTSHLHPKTSWSGTSSNSVALVAPNEAWRVAMSKLSLDHLLGRWCRGGVGGGRVTKARRYCATFAQHVTPTHWTGTRQTARAPSVPSGTWKDRLASAVRIRHRQSWLAAQRQPQTGSFCQRCNERCP